MNDLTLVTTSVVFAVEPLANVYDEASTLTPLHWDEIAPYKDLLFLNPDMELYRASEKAGRLLVITARAGAELVGYLLLQVHRHPHYKHVLCATEDMKYLRPEYRRGMTGARLIRFAEAEAKKRGCRLMTQRSKAKSGHGALYRRLGYELMDETYTKRLDGGGDGL